MRILGELRTGHNNAMQRVMASVDGTVDTEVTAIRHRQVHALGTLFSAFFRLQMQGLVGLRQCKVDRQQFL